MPAAIKALSSDLKLHCLAILQTVLEEHDIVDGDIDDLSLRRNRSLIGHNKGFLNMIVFILHEVVQRTVDGIVLARLHFNGDGGQGGIIVDEVIHLTFVAVIVIEQFVTMCDKFTGYDAFIDGAEIDAGFIVQHSSDVIAIKDAGQDTHIIQV